MRRLRFPAFLMVAALTTVGCGSETNSGPGDDTGDGNDEDRDNDRPDGGGRRDARAGDDDDDGDDGDDGVNPPGGGGITLPPQGSEFKEDRTGNSGLSSGDIDKLKGGGGSCDGLIVYPYDDVTFPVGLQPPAIMFSTPVDGSYLKLAYDKLDNVEYQTASEASDPGELNIDPADWTEVTRRTQGTILNATISVLRGGEVSTCNYKWHVAKGAMLGQIFYNTYNHPDLGGQGAVMRLGFDQPESEIYLRYEGFSAIAGPCISCHSVSFNGGRLAASTHNYNPATQSFQTNSYDVGPDPQPPILSPLPESTFAAFTPDGSKMLAMGNPDCTTGSNAFPRSPNNMPLLVGPTTAALHDAATGEVVPSKGLNPEWYMWMPQFSPKGDMVVFNHAKPGPNGTDRRELAVMKYDSASNTFSDLRVIVSNQGPEPSLNYQPMPTLSGAIAGDCPAPPGTDPFTGGVGAMPQGTCEGPCYPGWPFFTPNGEGVVYVLTSEPDFAAAFPGRDTPAKSELWYVDLASGETIRLDNANQGPRPQDAVENYYPTMLPYSVGGYYWLFWTSTRDWGHRDTNPTLTQVGANWFGGASVLSATRKRIWVSALRPLQQTEAGIEPLYDFSSKPFYLEGQSNSGNIRAFAALNACKEEGAECTAGLDCCTGFCDIEEGAEKGSCVPEKTCGQENDACKEDSDCCPPTDGGPELFCIGNYCGVRAL